VDVYSAADALEYFAHMSATLHGTHHTALPGAASPYTYAYTRREPLVCSPLQGLLWSGGGGSSA
jgi:hypothetical protein